MSPKTKHMPEESLINRVANSSLLTINLETYYPKHKIVEFDLKDYLYQGLILKEKDFRNALKELDLDSFQDNYVVVYCSADAIVPRWAYMLIATTLQPVAKDIYFTDKNGFLEKYYQHIIEHLDLSAFENQRLVIKGCSKYEVPESAYLDLTKRLRPIAKSIMYGEPCSTVPIYKQNPPGKG